MVVLHSFTYTSRALVQEKRRLQHEKELAEAKRRAEQEAQERAHQAHLAELKRQMEEQERLRVEQEKDKQAAIERAKQEVSY